jgi:hypothetical protein
MTHNAHGFISAMDFLKVHIQQSMGVKVLLQHEPIPESNEDDDDDPYHSYYFVRQDDNRRVYFWGLDRRWENPKTSPAMIDWANTDLSLCPVEVTGAGQRLWVLFKLIGLETLPGLKQSQFLVASDLYSNFKDEGFFQSQSLVVLEFKRRLTIENSARRIVSAQKTMDKHLAISPFLVD